MIQFKINGYLMIDEHPNNREEITEMQIWERFIDFVEENGWSFCGTTGFEEDK